MIEDLDNEYLIWEQEMNSPKSINSPKFDPIKKLAMNFNWVMFEGKSDFEGKRFKSWNKQFVSAQTF